MIRIYNKIMRVIQIQFHYPLKNFKCMRKGDKQIIIIKQEMKIAGDLEYFNSILKLQDRMTIIVNSISGNKNK